MKSFAFRLEAVLRIREGLAHREETQLAALFADRATLARRCVDARQFLHRLLLQHQDVVSLGTTGVEIILAEQNAQVLKRALRDLERQIEELKPAIAAQQERYAIARRELEKLETLREEQRDLWQKNQARREQSLNDDLFLARQWRNAKRARDL